eukprot:17485-Heterococcus_DN1.PRE.2
MIAQGWTHETQLLTWVVSYDGVRPPEPLAITRLQTSMHASLCAPTCVAVAAMYASSRHRLGSLMCLCIVEILQLHCVRETDSCHCLVTMQSTTTAAAHQQRCA